MNVFFRSIDRRMTSFQHISCKDKVCQTESRPGPSSGLERKNKEVTAPRKQKTHPSNTAVVFTKPTPSDSTDEEEGTVVPPPKKKRKQLENIIHSSSDSEKAVLCNTTVTDTLQRMHFKICIELNNISPSK